MKKQGFLCKISWQKSKQTAENVNKHLRFQALKHYFDKRLMGKTWFWGENSNCKQTADKSKQSADEKVNKQTAENVNKQLKM